MRCPQSAARLGTEEELVPRIAVKMATAAGPGRTSGSMMELKTRTSLALSISAASRSASGSWAKCVGAAGSGCRRPHRRPSQRTGTASEETEAEKRTLYVVAATFFLLAAYVAISALIQREEPLTSPVGVVISTSTPPMNCSASETGRATRT